MRSTRRSGFTLIELLIVVAIIGLLVTVLAGVLLGAFGKGKVAEAKDFMDSRIPQAMTKWQDAMGKPNRFPSSGTDPGDFKAGNALLYKELVANPRDKGNAPFMETTGIEEQTEGKVTVFLDPWGTPYIYRDYSAPPPKGMKASSGGTGSNKQYNPGTYDIISAGPDKEFFTADDIIRGGHEPDLDANKNNSGLKK